MIVWLMGLSGSGKTFYGEHLVREHGFLLLDGDEIRSELSSDLGFTIDDKLENGRRTMAMCRMLYRQANVVVATITSTESSRAWVREELKKYHLKMVWVQAAIETCRARDPKHLYRENPDNMTGVNQVWEDPLNADLVLNTDNDKPFECRAQLDAAIEKWLHEERRRKWTG